MEQLHLDRVNRDRTDPESAILELEPRLVTMSFPERRLQLWLQKQSSLPEVGELLFVGHASALERQVDTVFLAESGAIVLVEVKNERTTRQIIGQALEYAARLNDAAIEYIAEGYGRQADELRRLFVQRFGRHLIVSSRRHIVFLAPEFDLTCHVTVPYLRHLAGDKGVDFHLLRVLPAMDDFYLEAETRPVLASRMAAGSCGVSLRGTFYVVLAGGSLPVLWRVGGLERDEITPPKQSRIRFEDRLLHATLVPDDRLNLSESGSWWVKRSDPQKTAIVLGVLRDRVHGDRYEVARLRSGRFERVGRKAVTELHDQWTRRRDGFDWLNLRDT